MRTFDVQPRREHMSFLLVHIAFSDEQAGARTRKKQTNHLTFSRLLLRDGMPSSRLLAIHRAILRLTDAGEYIDHIHKDMEDPMVKSDGSRIRASREVAVRGLVGIQVS